MNKLLKDKIALITGGNSGNRPCHGRKQGFVKRGAAYVFITGRRDQELCSGR